MTTATTFTDNQEGDALAIYKQELNLAFEVMWNARQWLNKTKYCYNNWIGGITLRDVTKAQKDYDVACNKYQFFRMALGMTHTYISPTECEE